VVFTAKFWKDAGERMLFTALATLLASVTATDVAGKTNWKVVGITVAVATGGTLLKCLAASFKGDPDSASMVQ
jgi:hypothetical protein